MYSTHNEGKSVAVEKLIRTLKKQDLKTSVSKNVHIGKLDDIVQENNNKS